MKICSWNPWFLSKIDSWNPWKSMENASGHHEEGLHEIGRLGPLCQAWIDKMNNWHDNYSFSSYYDFINILSMLVSINITDINIHITYVKKSVVYCCFWKLCFIDRNAYFKPQFKLFFFGTSGCSISHIIFPLMLISLKLMCIPCI